jgi:hypothetical protein
MRDAPSRHETQDGGLYHEACVSRVYCAVGYVRAAVRPFLLSTRPFCRSRSTQANEVVATELRNRVIWTGDEVRPRVGEERLTNGRAFLGRTARLVRNSPLSTFARF